MRPLPPSDDSEFEAVVGEEDEWIEIHDDDGPSTSGEDPEPGTLRIRESDCPNPKHWEALVRAAPGSGEVIVKMRDGKVVSVLIR